MYAHKVIESLKNQRLSNNNDYTQQYETIINHINNSQKFHMGEVDTHMMLESYTGKQLFNDPSQVIVKFPYETIWIDWQDNSDFQDVDYNKGTVYCKKFGALIVTLNNKYYNILLFNRAPPMVGKVWLMTPVFFNLYYSENVGNFVIRSGHLKSLSRFGKSAISIIEKESNREITTINLFIDLLNCKNISTIDNDPPLKLNKKRIKNGKQPLFTYKTLVIKPTNKRQNSISKDIWDNRVHLCRGHFKEYTGENPLFGKYTGRYWWQPSVRGNKSKGIIHKDYSIESGITPPIK